jgi:ribosome-associated toxin RatA of RatAB toxin-antitoxin module
MWRLLLALVLVPRAIAATETTVETQRHGNAIEISARAEINASPETVWQVLTDYDHYTDFIPGLTVSRVLKRDQGSVVVEQKGEARFLVFSLPLEERLAVTEVPFRSVRSQATEGTLREMNGRYDLEPFSDGVRLTYVGRLVLAEEGPSFVDLIAVRLNVTRQFEALVREIDRRSAAAAGAGGTQAQ